ncbi:MAG: hypothetical protein IT565_07490, partial [Rhodospirillales bacterium]|nr:hypothetical protein [Rhodospirillales bacterium]
MLLSFASSSIWFAYDDHGRTLEREFRYLESNARIADAQFSGLLRSLDRLLAEIDANRTNLAPGREADFESYLVEQKRHFPEIHTLFVTDAKGRVIHSANPPLRGFDSSLREYFQAHQGQPLAPNFHVTRPFTPDGAVQSIAVSRAYYDAQKQFQGVIVAGFDPKYFEQILDQVRPDYPQSTALLFRLSGEFIYRLPNPERYLGASLKDGVGFHSHIASGKTATRRIAVARSDGIERLVVFRNISNSGVGVAVTRGYDDALAGWRRNLVLRI